MRAWVLFVLLLSFLGGCISGGDRGDDDNADPLGGVDAPRWQLGDWWTYTWESEIYARSYETTVVVGAIENGTYSVGMPSDAYSLDALLFHLPAVGPVSSNLSYGVHEVEFAPLSFPLHDGAAWDATYIAAPVHFVAHAMDETDANGTRTVFHITNEATKADSMRLYEGEYDPAVGWFTRFERIDLDGRTRERITLTDHGSGYVGDVVLIGDIDIVFLEGRTAAVLGADGLPAAPVTTFDPADDLDKVFVGCLYGDGAGAYEVDIQTPTGTACQVRGTVNTENVTRRMFVTELDNVAGDWNVRLAAAGQGLAIAEVMAYDAWTVTL